MKYEDECLRTLSQQFNMAIWADREWNPKVVNPNILHGAVGISTEAAEILDAVKKSIFYGKPFDLTNLQEEIGDCFWYLAILAKESGLSFDEIMQKNLAKLRARYPDEFNGNDALERDLDAERRALEDE